jgi:hypothetical protein
MPTDVPLMPASPEPVSDSPPAPVLKVCNDHWVSNGYQKFFATADRRVAVLDTASGRIVAHDRATKQNFAAEGFTTWLRNGELVLNLEKSYSRIEQSVLNQISLVSARNHGSELAGAVINLFAIHLVRSPAFKLFHERIANRFRREALTQMESDVGYAERFEAEFGRPARAGELRALAATAYDDLLADPFTLAESMVRHHNNLGDVLARFHMQVIEVDPSLPGLVLGDTPIVHADPATNRYGFRDSLAIGDASLIIGPLTRQVAACFSARPLPSMTIKTRKALDALNALFIRAATAEVACHPEDARRLQQVAGRLDRLPPSLFLDLARP